MKYFKNMSWLKVSLGRNLAADTPCHPKYKYYLLTTRITSNTDKVAMAMRCLLRAGEVLLNVRVHLKIWLQQL